MTCLEEFDPDMESPVHEFNGFMNRFQMNRTNWSSGR